MRGPLAAPGCRITMPVTPLIEACEAYPAMERLVLGAKRTVLMGFRLFDPDTRLRSLQARDLGLLTWRDLVANRLGAGVNVHVCHTDFDPAGGAPLHRKCWRNVRILQGLQGIGPGRLAVLPALHPHVAGPLPRAVFWWPVRRRLVEALKAEHGGEAEPPDYQALRARGGVPLWPPRPVWPVTHHQKMLVVDGERAILGGLDLDERFFDTHAHDRPADETWHDVSVQLEGPECAEAVRDAADHFAEVWGLSTHLTENGLESARSPELPPVAPATGEGTSATPQVVRFARTLSRRKERTLVGISPQEEHTGLQRAVLQLIAEARHFLYVETQYLRSRFIAEALARALERRPQLNLVMVLPAAPDDVAFERNDGPDARHGEALQVRCIERVRLAAGPRALFVSPVGARPPASEAESADPGRERLQKRWPIYVHAKVMIADSRLAMISSANLNGRSLRWDTEAGIVWDDPAGVRAFQQRLLTKHLRCAEPLPAAMDALECMHRVRQAARGDSDAPLARYPYRKARRFGALRPYIPDNMV